MKINKLAADEIFVGDEVYEPFIGQCHVTYYDEDIGRVGLNGTVYNFTTVDLFRTVEIYQRYKYLKHLCSLIEDEFLFGRVPPHLSMEDIEQIVQTIQKK